MPIKRIMSIRLVRVLALSLLPFVYTGCAVFGLSCALNGSIAQHDVKPGAPATCHLFNSDCCIESPGILTCGAPNEAKLFPCGAIHGGSGGCGCVEPSRSADGFEPSAVSAPITYTVPPFTFKLRFPFAGFESAQHLTFPVVLNSYQTFSGSVTYQPGFVFRGFTALGPADTTIGSYGIDVLSRDVVDIALAIRASTTEVAYVDVDDDGHKGVLDPTIVHLGNSPIAGAHTFTLALPAGGDTMRGFARSVMAFRAHVTLAAGILGNPSSPGNVGLSGTFTSVDPDTGDANDGQGLNPISATASPIAITIEESPLALVDPFLCYKTKASKGRICGASASANRGGLCVTDADCGGVTGACVKNTFPKGVQATLGDQFTGFTGRLAAVKKPLRLCAPAAVNGTPRHDATTQLRALQIAVAKTATPPAVVPNLAVTNTLGTIVLDIKAPDSTLVRARKALDAPAGALGANTVDDYQCYKAKLRTKRCAGAPTVACKSDLACGFDGPCVTKFPKGLRVSVVDDFTGGPKVFDVKKPTRLCTPAQNGLSPIQSPGGQLMCYQVKPAAGASKHAPVVGRLHTNGALGQERLDTVTEDEICIPSLELTTL